MAISNPEDFTYKYNSQYCIYLDLSGWDKTTFHVVAPMSGVMYPYASNDGGALQGVRYGNAQLAVNYIPVTVKNLTTNSDVSVVSAAGLYQYTVNAQFLKLQANPGTTPSSVYNIFFLHSKI